MNKLQNKVAIITGAGSGMGRAISLLFAREGAKVFLCDLNEETVRETCDRVIRDGGVAQCRKVDMSVMDQVVSLVEDAAKHFGGVEILVNNAGMFDGAVPADQMDEALWDKVNNVNIKGPFVAIKQALPYMLKAGKGAIVNIASIAGLVAGAGGPAYTASKHALIGLTKVVAHTYGHQGIRANAICPGSIISGMLPRETLADDSNPYAQVIKALPAGGAGEVEDIANAALFLASDDSAYVYGQTLVVDGGWTCQ